MPPGWDPVRQACRPLPGDGAVGLVGRARPWEKHIPAKVAGARLCKRSTQNTTPTLVWHGCAGDWHPVSLLGGASEPSACGL